jgi:hypothetical protein
MVEEEGWGAGRGRGGQSGNKDAAFNRTCVYSLRVDE